jgi:hypothetical protein
MSVWYKTEQGQKDLRLALEGKLTKEDLKKKYKTSGCVVGQLLHHLRKKVSPPMLIQRLDEREVLIVLTNSEGREFYLATLLARR